MATAKKFSKENPVYVSVPAGLTVEQTHLVTNEILRIVGCPTCYSGFKLHFLDESDLISAKTDENNELSVTVLN